MSEIDTGALGPGRIEPRELEQEMRSSFLDYAMSVIVSRALPDVRDGLKPVHRRVLYSMWAAGNRPGRPYVKCARIVGDVMGNYHPHGDTAIYDTLVRLAQPFSLRYPLVDGQGNFGSIDDDPPAAMRYCVANDTRITAATGSVRIQDIVSDALPESDHDVDLVVRDRLGRRACATKFFHSGDHPTLRLRTREGYELTGTHNHPVLCLVDMAGVPLLLWKLLEEISPGDRVLLLRTTRHDGIALEEHEEQEALLLGAFLSEGWVNERRAGFANVDPVYFDAVRAAYDAVVGGRRSVYDEALKSGSILRRLYANTAHAIAGTCLEALSGQLSHAKSVPEQVWRAPLAFKRVFLQALFEGDGLLRCCRERRSRSRTRRGASSSRVMSTSSSSSSASSHACAITRRARPRS